MQTNPFPAILLAGSPHSGKSVLSYLLTEHLRQMKVHQYLLRVIPDEEDDWYHIDDQEIVYTLRSQYKCGFSTAFVAHIRKAIEKRWLPLLVDMSGKPQGDQFDLICACTHSILLYRDEADYLEWRSCLARAGLQPVAELHSKLDIADQILDVRPVLNGTIGGLQREIEDRRIGAAFGALVDRVAGVFHYNALELERIHLPGAPLPALTERGLADELGVHVDQKIFWEPWHLAQLEHRVPVGKSYAFYGRGPVWLAAMLAAHAYPAPYAVFDTRFGWLDIPAVRKGPEHSLKVKYSHNKHGLWVDINLPQQGILEPGSLSISAPPAEAGVILSGQLPCWAFAALARFFSITQAWVGVNDAERGYAIVVWSKTASQPLGSVLARR